MVTFDDGYADNLYQALPLLERFDIEARFFLVSGAIDSRTEMWWDALDRLHLQNEADFDPEGACFTPGQQEYLEWFFRLRRLPAADREATLDRQFAEAGIGRTAREERRTLTGEETVRLAASPLVEVGAHTVTHPVLSSLSAAEQQLEIAGSKHALEELLGHPVTGFAYPNGTDADFDSGSMQAVANAGFQYAYSAFQHARPGCLQLPRVMIRDWDGEQFAKALATADFERQRD